jgi:hypothetical protein
MFLADQIVGLFLLVTELRFNSETVDLLLE